MSNVRLSVNQENDFSKIEGLPPGAVVRSTEIERLLARGAWTLVATPGHRDGLLNVACHPAEGSPAAYVPRDRRPGKLSYRDPAMSGLKTVDADSEISFRFAEPLDNLAVDFEGVTGSDGVGLVYRGMSHEEFEGIAEAGGVCSQGEWNLGGQDGLTYWTTSPSSAAHYANGFAPMHRRPCFGRPAYVVATRRPAEVRPVEGTGSHEVGVERMVGADEVVAAWRGNVYDFDPGVIDLILGYDGEWRTGGMVQLSARVAWERIDDLDLQEALGMSRAPGPR